MFSTGKRKHAAPGLFNMEWRWCWFQSPGYIHLNIQTLLGFTSSVPHSGCCSLVTVISFLEYSNKLQILFTSFIFLKPIAYTVANWVVKIFQESHIALGVREASGAHCQEWNSKHFCPLRLGIRVAAKTQRSQGLGGTMLYSHKEELEQDQLQSWPWCPVASGFLLAARACQLAHTPFLCCTEGPCPLPAGGTYSRKVEQAPYDPPAKA